MASVIVIVSVIVSVKGRVMVVAIFMVIVRVSV